MTPGEVIDKMTILEVKLGRLRDLSRDAFDADEVMYRDLADPPFDLDAPNPDIAGRRSFDGRDA